MTGPFTASDVDYEHNLDTLTWSVLLAPEHGTVEVVGVTTNVDYTYRPHAYYAGSDSFTIRMADRYGNSDDITVTVTITGGNDPGKPVFIFE